MSRVMLRVVTAAALAAVLFACSWGAQSLRDGLLRVDIGQKAFLSQWGEPEKILPVLSKASLSQRWGTPLDFLKVEEDEPLELWVYERYGTELLFQEGDLMAWKTTLTREQLKKIPRGEVP